jgi:murein endopeptidase
MVQAVDQPGATMTTTARSLCLAITMFVAAVAGPRPAEAKRLHTVTTGQSLWTIARRYSCSVDEIQRANRLAGTMIRPGQRLTVPSCARPTVAARRVTTSRATKAPTRVAAIIPVTGQSIGRAWDGTLEDGIQLPPGDGYLLRRPARTWGASHVVSQVERTLAEVMRKLPDHHTLAIGDLSAKHGGFLTEHHSHQSGRDIDIGFYYKQAPRNYPSEFVIATEDTLDAAATWTLLYTFARTADQSTGVTAIFLDYDMQGVLYRYALDHGVSKAYLGRIFQYPHGRGAAVGLIRHVAHHDDHFHVRYKCAPGDRSCS